MIKGIIEAVGDTGSALVARLIARRAGDATVVVLDIDNTIADSWPSFLVDHTGETQRLASISPLPGMKQATHDAALERGDVVTYLTHRNLWHYPVTYRWLRRHGFSVSPLRLMVVSAAAKKPDLLAVLASGRELEVWDDLSAGHETGEVRVYDDVRAEFDAIATRYFGAEAIAEVVASATSADEAS